jgi:glucose/arabinose dehydrogenase
MGSANHSILDSTTNNAYQCDNNLVYSGSLEMVDKYLDCLYRGKGNFLQMRGYVLRTILVTLLLLLALSACTLKIGGPSSLPDPPAPTALPLTQPFQPIQGEPGRQIALPPGFSISIFAQGLDDPRMMAIGPEGQLYVAERGAGRVLRLPDADGDGELDQIEVAASGLRSPSSLAFFQDGSLYVGETRRILRLPPAEGQTLFAEPEVVVDALPSGGHNTRTVLFSPDYSTLFVSIGSSCNVCDEDDQRRAAIMRYDPDGSDGQLFAQGLRNAVGITFKPGTQELWVTNNGRDFLGDDLPPETIYLVQGGKDYGWPRCHSGRIVDPDFGDPGACENVEAPQVEMQAHSAPLGLEFYTGDQFPPEYHGDMFVAFHGSWNRSEPVGYKIVRVPFTGGSIGPVEDFAVGWLVGGSSWGRPVDLITAPGGSLFISDDAGGRIYRISFE